MVLWLKAGAMGLLIPGIFNLLLPWLILRFTGKWPPAWQPAAVIPGALLMVLGFLGMWWVVQAFVRLGRGTPAPFDPPKQFVASGLYRYVRNPMYLGATLALAGAALATLSWVLALYALIIFCGFNLYLMLFEEAALCRRFGAPYEAYLRRVPRWIPRRPRA